MAIRHMIFATVFIAVFGVGMVNVMTDGRLVHELRSELPNHAGDGNVSIEAVDTIELEPGETKLKTVRINNGRRISYGDPTLSSNMTEVKFSMSLQPPPSGAEQSLPPTYFYSHQEKTADAKLNFTVDEDASSANLSFELKGQPGDVDSPETVREIPVRVK